MTLASSTAAGAFSGIATAAERDLPRLFDIWESSVRASHSFLEESDIQSLIPLVKAELASFSPIHCLRADDGNPFAMLGVAGTNIEMLFVHGNHLGKGAGGLLTRFAIQVLGARSVDVNEQNAAAIAFYHRFGFRQVGRSACDPNGNAFPILHMSLQAPGLAEAS